MIVHGTKNVDLFECTNPQLNKWRVRWNVQPDNSQENEKINEDLVTYNEVEFLYKPSIDEIKELIFNWYNNIIDSKILSDFIWEYNGVSYPVWLSSENQFNYKAIYDLAIQTNCIKCLEDRDSDGNKIVKVSVKMDTDSKNKAIINENGLFVSNITDCGAF